MLLVSFQQLMLYNVARGRKPQWHPRDMLQQLQESGIQNPQQNHHKLYNSKVSMLI